MSVDRKDVVQHTVWGGMESPQSSYSAGAMDNKKNTGPVEGVAFESASFSSSSLQDVSSHTARSSLSHRRRKQESSYDGKVWSDDGSSEEGENDDFAGGTWSVGSQHHASGNCKPCHYVHKKTGCQNGAECPFCHMDHKRVRPRLWKSQRDKLKRVTKDMSAQDAKAVMSKAALELFSRRQTASQNMPSSSDQVPQTSRNDDGGGAGHGGAASPHDRPKQVVSL